MDLFLHDSTPAFSEVAVQPEVAALLSSEENTNEVSARHALNAARQGLT